MNRIKCLDGLKLDIVTWLKDYLTQEELSCFVVGVSGGIDSAVSSTLAAETGHPTYVVSLPLMSKQQNHRLSHDHCKFLEEKYENVTYFEVELSGAYDHFHHCLNWWSETKGFKKTEFTSDELTNANTKARLRMMALYQIAGSKGGMVVGTGNKVEDFGIGFFTKYGDGGVDISPIADLYKTEVWELGKYLGVDQRIIDATPTDGLWDDGRTDEDQIGASYEDLEWVMESGIVNTKHNYLECESWKGEVITPQLKTAIKVFAQYHKQNRHKMVSVPIFQFNQL